MTKTLVRRVRTRIAQEGAFDSVWAPSCRAPRRPGYAAPTRATGPFRASGSSPDPDSFRFPPRDGLDRITSTRARIRPDVVAELPDDQDEVRPDVPGKTPLLHHPKAFRVFLDGTAYRHGDSAHVPGRGSTGHRRFASRHPRADILWRDEIPRGRFDEGTRARTREGSSPSADFEMHE
jgi:hypothetical protein